MLDFSFAELALIILVAVIFIGPKELPLVIRGISKALRAVRSLTSEVHKALDDLSRESGIKEAVAELHNEVNSVAQEAGDKLPK
jgi:sec-independent protein translocase protein TatB